MAKQSADEAMTARGRESQAKGSPMKKEMGVKSTLPEGMKTPKAPGEQHMGGVKKSVMGRAVGKLEHDTERGSHAPSVGGHKMSGHSGKMG